MNERKLYLAMVVLLAGFGLNFVQADTLYTQDFSGAVGTAPSGWTNANDAFAIDSNHEYKSEPSPTGSAGSSYYNVDGEWDDYIFSTDVRFTGTGVNSGIAGRIKDGGASLYLYRYTWGTGAMQLLRANTGNFTVLANAAEPITVGEQYYMRMIFDGDTITGQVASDSDFNNLVSETVYVDSSPGLLTSGGIGYRISRELGTAHAFYADNVSVTDVPEPFTLGIIGSGGIICLMRRKKS